WPRYADGLRHHPVLRRRANPDPISAEFEEQPEGADNRGGKQRNDQPIPRIVKVEEREVAGEWLLDFACDRTELPERVVLQYQRHAEGGKDRRQRIAAQEWA